MVQKRLRTTDLDAHWDHRHNTHTHIRFKIIQSTSTHSRYIHNIQQPHLTIFRTIDKGTIDKGTSYRLISLLTVIAKTLEKSLLPYITAIIPNTPNILGYKSQQRYKTQHYSDGSTHITITTSTHTSTSKAKKYIQSYLHQVLAWTNTISH